ncbi:unnamed protein product, partial [Thlaspi arvense]
MEGSVGILLKPFVMFYSPVVERKKHELSQFTLLPNGWSPSSVFLNIYHLLLHSKKTTNPPDIRAAFSWILWQIWMARNATVFENVNLSPSEITVKAFDEADEWTNVNCKESSVHHQQPTLPIASPMWIKPPLNKRKCNIGVSWIHPRRNSGASWLLRDHQGLALCDSRRCFSQERHYFIQTIFLNIAGSLILFSACLIIHETANRAAQAIPVSVTRDHRYQSYVAHQGPFWLHKTILEDV